MARALCELQLELQFHSSSCTKAQQTDMNNFIPKTPVGKESQKRKGRVSSASSNLSTKLLVTKMDWDEVDTCLTMVDTRIKRENLTPNFSINSIEDNSCGICKSCVGPSGIQSLQQTQCKRIWNFPSPWELANLDERFLSKRCGLGYRAGRIIKLSQGIVEGRIPMRELEQVCNGGSLNSYNELADQLKEIDGFGPFTRANVLMCMGFYHVIPADSETVRHIKQVHAKNSTIQTVHKHIEEIYGKYTPLQFLAYWTELWHFYEQRFGKFYEMPCSEYKLITASNMRNKGSCKIKRAKIS
ncbi:uncharacterized protein LOC119370590 [Jatropha curcas]|nr:uncharacterized protein LOC119370590 [Jatropha curcas]